MGETRLMRATITFAAMIIAAAATAIPAYCAQPPAVPAAEAAPPAVTLPASSANTVWNFDNDRAYKPATGWTVVRGPWTVVQDPSAPSQPNVYGLKWVHFWTSLARMVGYYSIAVVKDPAPYSDFTLKVDFKPNGGAFDSAGGLILRYQNDRNYYVMVAQIPGQTVDLWRVKDGQFTLLGRAPVELDRQTWYHLKVRAQGDHFACYLNGKMLYTAQDGTFSSGRYGLWGHSDSTARFDDVEITPVATASK